MTNSEHGNSSLQKQHLNRILRMNSSSFCASCFSSLVSESFLSKIATCSCSLASLVGSSAFSTNVTPFDFLHSFSSFEIVLRRLRVIAPGKAMPSVSVGWGGHGGPCWRFETRNRWLVRNKAHELICAFLVAAQSHPSEPTDPTAKANTRPIEFNLPQHSQVPWCCRLLTCWLGDLSDGNKTGWLPRSCRPIQHCALSPHLHRDPREQK